MSSKRKRNTVHFESSSTRDTQNVPATTTARTITVGHGTSGRLTQQSDITEVEISPEDLAILLQAPEFSISASSLIDFERVVQEDVEQNENQDNSESQVVEETPKERVSPKSLFAVLRVYAPAIG